MRDKEINSRSFTFLVERYKQLYMTCRWTFDQNERKWHAYSESPIRCPCNEQSRNPHSKGVHLTLKTRFYGSIKRLFSRNLDFIFCRCKQFLGNHIALFRGGCGHLINGLFASFINIILNNGEWKILFITGVYRFVSQINFSRKHGTVRDSDMTLHAGNKILC